MNQNNILIGCTFTPEKYPDQSTVLEGFRFVLDEMNLRNIRFALRWNKMLMDDGTLSLGYYQPFFDIMNEYDDIVLCLNLGPIKTTDWPEMHVPRSIMDSLKSIPRWPRELPASHEITKVAGDYLHRICRLLQKQLPEHIINSIKILQLNNEGYNPFGEDRIVMSIDSELYFESIASTYFPGRAILFNSAGRLQNRKILNTQSRLNAPSILGIDYYYHTPDNDYPILRDIDVLDLPFVWTPSMQSVIKALEKTGNTLEITEAQMEQWGHITYPGESLDAFKKMLSRLTKLQPSHQETLLVRIWGVELFAHGFMGNTGGSGKHKKLLQYIASLNQLGE